MNEAKRIKNKLHKRANQAEKRNRPMTVTTTLAPTLANVNPNTTQRYGKDSSSGSTLRQDYRLRLFSSGFGTISYGFSCRITPSITPPNGSFSPGQTCAKICELKSQINAHTEHEKTIRSFGCSSITAVFKDGRENETFETGFFLQVLTFVGLAQSCALHFYFECAL